MIKKQILKSTFISLFSLFVIAFVGCSQVLSPEVSAEEEVTTPATESSPPLASLNITVGDGSARTITTSFDTSKIKGITLKGKFGTNAEAELKTWSSYTDFMADPTVTGLKTGAWEFTLSCKVGDFENAYSGTKTITLAEGANTIAFTLTENPAGTGKIEIILDYSSCTNASIVNSVDIYFYEYGNSAGASVAGTINEKKVVFTNSNVAVKNGLYIVKFTLKDSGNNELTSAMELVRVATGFTTTGTVTVSGLKESYSITYAENGGTWVGSFTAPASYTQYDDVTLPTATNINRANYKFDGWYDAGGNKVTGWKHGEKTGNVALTAKWIYWSNELYVTYETSAGGTKGNDETGDGSSGNPFATVQKAIETISDIEKQTNSFNHTYTINVTGEIANETYGTVAKFDGFTNQKISIIGPTGKATFTGNKSNSYPNKDSVILIQNSTGLNLTLKNLIIQYGGASNGGGICNNGAIVTVENCDILNCMATVNGGGIYNAGTLTMTNCTINKNNTNGYGGAIYVIDGSSTTLNNCVIGDENASSPSDIPDSLTYCASMDGGGNCAGSSGGGIYVFSKTSLATVRINRCTIARNYSDDSGGGIGTNNDASTKNIQIKNSTIKYNYANSNGGAINAYGQDNSSTPYPNNYIKETVIKGNKAGGNGGGISIVNNSYFGLINCNQIFDNTATGKGNGIYLNGTLKLYENVKIDSGNDVHMLSGGRIFLTDSFSTTGLSATEDVAVITPVAYPSGTSTVTVLNGTIGSYNEKFAVTKQNGTTEWIINSSGKLIRPKNKLEVVYLDSSATTTAEIGDATDPVKTLEDAIDTLDTTVANPTIMLMSPYILSTDEENLLDFSGKKQVTIKRADGFKKSSNIQHGREMFIVDSKITVNIANVILDGNDFTSLTDSVNILKIVGDGTVKIGNNTTLKKCNEAAISVGMSAGNDATLGTLEISGTSIKFEENEVPSYTGLINIEATGNAVINNCLFENNILGYGYCIHNSGSLVLSGIIQIKDDPSSLGYYICNLGTLTLSGKITDGKNICLGSDSTLSIGTGFSNSSTDIINVVLLRYTFGNTVITGDKITQEICDSFVLSDPAYRIKVDSTEKKGVLVLRDKYYVDSSSGDDENNGTSGKPFKTIQKAVDTVIMLNKNNNITDETQRPKFEIYLNGTFTATSGTRLVDLLNGIGTEKFLYISLKAKDKNNKPTLKGDGKTVIFINSIRTNIYKFALDNLIIQSSTTANENGAGVYYSCNSDCELNITNCEFKDNKTTSPNGGAIYCSGPLKISDTKFDGNSAGTYGDAIFFDTGSSIEMKGDMQFSTTNDNIYLAAGVSIKLTGDLGATTSARVSLAPTAYADGTVVLQADDVALITNNKGKFKLNKLGSITEDCTDYNLIQPDSNKKTVILKDQSVSGTGITVEISGDGCTATYSTPKFGEELTLTVTSSSTPSSLAVELYKEGDSITSANCIASNTATNSKTVKLNIPDLSAVGTKYVLRIVAVINGLSYEKTDSVTITK